MKVGACALLNWFLLVRQGICLQIAQIVKHLNQFEQQKFLLEKVVYAQVMYTQFIELLLLVVFLLLFRSVSASVPGTSIIYYGDTLCISIAEYGFTVCCSVLGVCECLCVSVCAGFIVFFVCVYVCLWAMCLIQINTIILSNKLGE